MSDYNIPTRPDGYDYKGIKRADCDCLTAAVLLGIKNEDAFRLYHPEYLDSRGRISEHGSEVAKQFFNAPKYKEYTKAFKATIEKFCEGKGGEDKPVEISEKRKDVALRALLDKAMKIVEGEGELDPDTLKTATEIFRKLSILKDEVEQEIKPIRVLPSRCSECRMRIFVESAVANGEVLDMCAYCRARRIAEDNGFRFNDGRNLLDIPKDVIAKLESNNNVKLEDIINGKIDN